MEHLRQRVGRRAANGRCSSSDPGLSIDNSPDPSMTATARPARHSSAEAPDGIDRGNRAWDRVLGRHHGHSCLRCAAGSHQASCSGRCCSNDLSSIVNPVSVRQKDTAVEPALWTDGSALSGYTAATLVPARPGSPRACQVHLGLGGGSTPPTVTHSESSDGPAVHLKWKVGGSAPPLPTSRRS